MVSYAEFQKMELRVATILEAGPHPNADKLLLLKVKVGEKEKQIVAGIRKFRESDALIGKQIIIVDNLEPAVLRGERSEGMLLAVLADGEFALLQPDAKVPDGSRVS